MMNIKGNINSIIIIALLSLVSIMNVYSAETLHRIGTYNIRIITAADTEDKSWENRKEYVGRIITDNDFDVVGFQEISQNGQEDDLKTLLPNYTIVSWGRESATEKSGERVAVGFKKNRYNLLEEGHFFLSTDPSQPLLSWDSNYRRITVYTKLQDKNSKEIFYFFSTHLDNGGIVARREGSRLNIEKATKLAGSYPVFIVGDFNATQEEATMYNTMAAYYDDSRLISTSTPVGIVGTFCNWSANATSAKRIDYIFCKHVNVETYKTINSNYGRSVTPSDHYPVLTSCSFKDVESKRTRWHVSTKTSSSPDGSIKSPFNNLQDAIDAASSRDTILVTQGEFYPKSKVGKSGRKARFEIDKSLTITGGYSVYFSAITGRTTLSGDYLQNDETDESENIITNSEDNLHQIVTVQAPFNLHFENIKITGGYADDAIQKQGAAIYSEGSLLSLKNVEISENHSSGNGGALFVSGNLFIENCRFINNSSDAEGGAFSMSSSNWKCEVINSFFSGNKANKGSAGYLPDLAQGYFYGNTYSDNQSKLFGTLSFISAKTTGNITLVNNTFANNTLPANSTLYNSINGGAAVFCNMLSGSKLNLVNNTVCGNKASCLNNNGDEVSNFYGAAVHVVSGDLSLYNNIIAGNYSTSSTGGDVYVSPAGGSLKNSKKNVYTSLTNLNITPDNSDIYSSGYAIGMENISRTLSGTLDKGKFTLLLEDYGEDVPTISILSSNYGTKSICILSLADLNEENIGIDLDNDDLISGILTFDQKGFSRKKDGTSTIGSCEYGYGTSIGSVLNKEESIGIVVHPNELYITDNGIKSYRLYDIQGRNLCFGEVSRNTINITRLSAGVYFAELISANKKNTYKFIKR